MTPMEHLPVLQNLAPCYASLTPYKKEPYGSFFTLMLQPPKITEAEIGHP